MASDPTVRAQRVFWDNKLVDIATGGSIKFEKNSAKLMVNGKYVGESDGPLVNEQTIKFIRPEETADVPIIEDMINNKKIALLTTIGGGKSLAVQRGNIISGSLQWNEENGLFEGEVMVRYGKPELLS